MIFRRRRRIEASSSSSSNVGLMMNLSLFIMLLAFFIVLNAISDYEEIKTENVKRSLEIAFSNDPDLEESMSSETPDPVQAMREGRAFDRINALFNAEISSFKKEVSYSRGIMMVELPFDEFSEAVTAVGQKDLLRYPSRRSVRGNFFLPTLSSILRTEIDGVPTRMEIIVHTDENPARMRNQEPAELSSVVNRVGNFARQFGKVGMPQKLINIGLEKGDPEMVQLVFRRHVVFSPIKSDELIEAAPDE